MITIPTTGDLDLAAQLKFPPYSIQLPEWANLGSGPNLPDNVTQEPTYTPGKHALNCTISLKDRIDVLKKKYAVQMGHIEANRQNESAPNSDPGNPLGKVPNPDSDCRHVDPDQAGGTFRGNFSNMMAQFKALEAQAKNDGELAIQFANAKTTLADVANLLATGGGGPLGMQRLRLIFQWTLCQVITVFGEINAALDAKSQANYTTARQAYMELMRDLDDSEPNTGPKPPAAGVSGYGKVIKWSYIMPLIHGGRIKGAKVMAKWNPHVSSSGIPIPHA